MIVIQWILYIFSWLFFSSGVFIIFACFISFIRFKDFFIRMFAIKISNIYGISAILFAQALISGDLLIFIELSVIIILNVLITITVVHTISRISLNNNIIHNGTSRRKYNEMIAQKEKEEAEKKAKERITLLNSESSASKN